MEHGGIEVLETHAEALLPGVRRVMQVDEVTTGAQNEPFAVRFGGRLVVNSLEAYTKLEPLFEQRQLTLMLRDDKGRHAVLGVGKLPEGNPSNPRVNLLLFLLTLASVVFAGVLSASGYRSALSNQNELPALDLALDLPLGAAYAVSLLAILLAHEFGHYWAARYHNTPVTLPYFLPFPGSVFGTLGAFIRIKHPPRNRRVLMDIGLAGPLAGLLVAIPVLFLGLALSSVGTLPAAEAAGLGITLEGNSVLYLAIKYLVKGEMLPAPISYGGLHPVLYWIRYLVLGLPAPLGGRDVLLHPVAWAGWAGLLVTALNLIPAGQLDGGHTIYVLLGKRAIRLWPVVMVALVALGAVWSGWWLWALLIFFLGRTYAQPLDEITELDPRRRAIAIFGLILFALVFTPVPLRSFPGGF